MSAPTATKKRQNACLEGDTNGEGKVKKMLLTAAELETECLHLRFLVDVVLPRVSQPVLKTPRFGCQRPNQAFPGWESFWLEAEGLILKS